MRNGASVLMASLCLAASPTQAAIIGTCTINIGSTGTLAANPAISVLGSTQASGSAASVTITTASTLCSILALLDCYGISAPAPTNFLSAPSGGDANVTFASTYTIAGVTYAGSTITRVSNATRTIPINLTATKSTGIFPAGSYHAEVTVRCE